MQAQEPIQVLFSAKREGATALRTRQGKLTLKVSAIMTPKKVVVVDIRSELGFIKDIQQLEVPDAKSAFVCLQNALSQRGIARTIEARFELNSDERARIIRTLTEIAEEMIIASEATQSAKPPIEDRFKTDSDEAWRSTVAPLPPTISESGSMRRVAGTTHVLEPN
jgi:hypothetical protein